MAGPPFANEVSENYRFDDLGSIYERYTGSGAILVRKMKRYGFFSEHASRVSPREAAGRVAKRRPFHPVSPVN